MKEMCRIIPAGSCPSCGHKQFFVMQGQVDQYITNGDGVVIDFKELEYKAIGKCLNCNKEYEMMPTTTGFIPLTPLRKILYDYTPHLAIEESYSHVDNPMEMR